MMAGPSGADNRIRAIAFGRSHHGGTQLEHNGSRRGLRTVQQSKHYNSDYTEKKIKLQIYTENDRVTWRIPCMRSNNKLIFSVRSVA